MTRRGTVTAYVRANGGTRLADANLGRVDRHLLGAWPNRVSQTSLADRVDDLSYGSPAKLGIEFIDDFGFVLPILLDSL